MKYRDCCRREVYACLGAMSLFLFEVVAIAAPWYAVLATGLPPPPDTLTAVFWWGGMEAVYSPPIVPPERSYTIYWADMITTQPKDVYMSSIAMCFLALFFDLALCFIIFFGQICKGTSRILNMMFCGLFKWVVVAVSGFVLLLVILSWTIFFAFNAALNNAKLCPGTTAYSPGPFPYISAGSNYSNCPPERLWCDSFANSRLTYGVTNWIWAPSIGWIFALVSTVLAFYVLVIELTVGTGSDYETIGERRGGKSHRGERDSNREKERIMDDEKMKRKYNRFDV